VLHEYAESAYLLHCVQFSHSRVHILFSHLVSHGGNRTPVSSRCVPSGDTVHLHSQSLTCCDNLSFCSSHTIQRIPSSSTSGPVTGSAWTSSASSGSSPAQQEAAPAGPGKRQQKAKEKKRRQKEKKKVAARQRSDEAKAEVVDDGNDEPELRAAATLVDTWTARNGSTWESYGRLCDELEMMVQFGMVAYAEEDRPEAWSGGEEMAEEEWV